MKHTLKTKYYIRYAGDFVIFSEDKNQLKSLLLYIGAFLHTELKLELHPNKVFIETLASGIDFLGWVNFSDHRVVRTTTKKRMLKRIRVSHAPETLASYHGLLKHGNGYKLQKLIQ